MKSETVLKNIKVEQLYPHPDNPRKEIGDLSEMVESVKKNGIMQNLTVIPLTALHDEPDEQPDADNISLLSDFHVLIGHRRLAAAKQAGLKEVPCKIISKISKKEQVSIMLEENMQRNDLTIYEQAQGFQMMLDLGDTEEQIAEKTGFSRSTIRRRLSIAKLDPNELKKKEQDNSFQLTLKDLYELEKIEDIETRNKILKASRDSRDLAWKAQSAVKEAEREKKAKEIIELLKAAGIEPAPKGAENEMYSGKWETVKEFELEKEVPKRINLKKETDPLYYMKYWRAVRVIKKFKKEKKEATPEELVRKQRDKNKKEINAIVVRMDARRREFILNIISGKIAPIRETEKIKDEIWDVLVAAKTCVEMGNITLFFRGKPEYQSTQEEKDEAKRQAESLSIIHQMLTIMHYGMEYIGEIVAYDGTYKSKTGQTLRKGYKILERYGWSFDTDEEEKILDGTHELYVQEKTL